MADISPVKAPLSSSLQFCAPIFIKSGKADFAEPKSVKGGHKMISFGFVCENVENSSVLSAFLKGSRRAWMPKKSAIRRDR